LVEEDCWVLGYSDNDLVTDCHVSMIFLGVNMCERVNTGSVFSISEEYWKVGLAGMEVGV